MKKWIGKFAERIVLARSSVNFCVQTLHIERVHKNSILESGLKRDWQMFSTPEMVHHGGGQLQPVERFIQI